MAEGADLGDFAELRCGAPEQNFCRNFDHRSVVTSRSPTLLLFGGWIPLILLILLILAAFSIN